MSYSYLFLQNPESETEMASRLMSKIFRDRHRKKMGLPRENGACGHFMYVQYYLSFVMLTFVKITVTQ